VFISGVQVRLCGKGEGWLLQDNRIEGTWLLRLLTLYLMAIDPPFCQVKATIRFGSHDVLQGVRDFQLRSGRRPNPRRVAHRQPTTVTVPSNSPQTEGRLSSIKQNQEQYHLPR
jgi:hypothetical protein